MDELTLDKGIPLLVTPTTVTTVHNTMTSDDPLLVSSHGDVEKKWLEVFADGYVKFETPLYFLQTTGGQIVLPVYETL